MSKIVIAFYDKAEQARQIGQELAPLASRRVTSACSVARVRLTDRDC
jgi:hypothetical protein